ncbi:branched chain amino acid aminotransferase [Bordetella holmesii]|uniref:branched-chain amino acid aminotransferase n=1 Tax=Bordetella holmesii TaxID=35814 RepID=UPI000C781163|nr:branched-chain amino acid aminotransferase [Bordetella holmesii]AUL20787.1 branched chain amino acid aminotransferase [Bordetella holmesii]AUL52118.1 branched chain amino acid aminotransferase [Bordetella holmesii]
MSQDKPEFLLERHPSPVAPAERERLLQDPGFGRIFTDHMATVRYNADRGWHDAKIEARADLRLNPSTLVLHYAQEIFEGLKAYRLPDGSATLFRPQANARRFRNSAARLAMAELPEAVFVESVEQLVRLERDWIPSADGASLYLRPFMIATEVALGTKPSADYLYAVIASPVGAYFKGGGSAVTIWVSDNYTRAAPGGTGAAKCGGNYAASLQAQAEGARQGCDQVVFLDAVERRWVEELGGMNVFFVFADGSLQTPPLTGTILPGITRDSLITLARDLGMTVREEPYAIDQWEADAKSGKLVESFACGTAAVVTPIGQVKGRQHGFTIGSGAAGEITVRLKAALEDIQRGRSEDKHGWLHKVA